MIIQQGSQIYTNQFKKYQLKSSTQWRQNIWKKENSKMTTYVISTENNWKQNNKFS